VNVLVLMCDHHRHDALGCLGNPLAHTPNLDRLAARSVRFRNCYTQAPVCAPARHSLATGRYCHAHGVLDNRLKPGPGMFTIAHAVQPLGYRRLQFGHMHWTDPGADTGYEPYAAAERDWQAKLPEAMRARLAWESQGITRRTTGGPGPRSVEQHRGYHVARAAAEAIEQAVSRDEPFLCWVAFSEPHPPFYPPKELYEMIDQSQVAMPAQPPADAPPPHPRVALKQEEWAHLTAVEVKQIIAGYYGMVALADRYLGMVLDAVEGLGALDDTLIVWTSDHGEQLYEHRLFTKFVMREASVHVPLLVSHPSLEAGVRDELVEHVDLFPTICEFVGATVPDSVHGRSLAALLRGGVATDGWRDAVFSQIEDVRMIRTRDSKLNVYGSKPGELFDLRNDPCEFHNLIDHPSHRETREALFERVKQWERTFR